MSIKTVYLAGPISFCGREANDWRDVASRFLKRANIQGISPLRCEPLHGATYEYTHPDPRFGTAKAIASKNLFDVQTCDLSLFYLMAEPNAARLSIGTIIELGWAHALRKPTIVVSDLAKIIEHPVVIASAGWIVPTLQDGLDICTGILGDYARQAQ